MHIAANTFNDYFDWKAGTDKVNNSYFLPYSGGSRSIELGLISEKALFRVALVSLLISGALGVALAVISGPLVLLFGLMGAFSSYYYTAPPLRLAARRGLGELVVGLNFGPLATAGTVLRPHWTGHTHRFPDRCADWSADHSDPVDQPVPDEQATARPARSIWWWSWERARRAGATCCCWRHPSAFCCTG